VAGGAVVAIALAGVGLWTLRSDDEPAPVTGTGRVACRQLLSDLKSSHYVDSRVVDGTTAASWLGDISTHADPAAYQGDRRVTVCLTSKGQTYTTYAIGGDGRPYRVTLGAFPAVSRTMAALDRLSTGGRSTTHAPFTCPGTQSSDDPDVSLALPSGATGARICFFGVFDSPSVVLTDSVDELVNAVNAEPVGYSAPHFVCGGGDEYEYAIVFRYPDGTRAVSTDQCSGLVVGRFTRSSGHLDSTFMSLLRKQVDVVPGSVTPPACPASPRGRPAGVGDVRNVVAARFCPAGSNGPGSELSGDAFRLLRTWGTGLYGAESVPENSCRRPAAGWPALSLADAWGNHFSMIIEGCGKRVFPGLLKPGDPEMVAHPDGPRDAFVQLARQLGAG